MSCSLPQRLQNRNDATGATLRRMEQKMRGDVQAYLELASDYFAAGMWERRGRGPAPPDRRKDAVRSDLSAGPLLPGLRSSAAGQNGCSRSCVQGSSGRARATTASPFGSKDLDVLHAALAVNPQDARAYYYLGNLLFDLQPDRAIEYWEKSRAIDDSLATVHRNLGWAYYRVKNDVARAIGCYEQALACGDLDPRLFLELDTLYEFGNVAPSSVWPPWSRTTRSWSKRQDSFQREIMVLVLTGKYDRAIEYLENNFFHAQEGRNEIHNLFVDAHLLEGMRLMQGRSGRRGRGSFPACRRVPGEPLRWPAQGGSTIDSGRVLHGHRVCRARRS